MESLVRVCELALSKPRPYFSNDSDYPKNYYKGSELGSQPLAGVYKATKYDSHNKLIYDIKYSIGKDRFRLTPGVFRNKKDAAINFFGCSFMFGEGVKDSDTVPAKFNVITDRFIIKNYAGQGFGAHQALKILLDMPSPHDKNTINFFQTAAWHSDRVICQKGMSASGNPVFLTSQDGSIFYFGSCRSVWEGAGNLNSLSGILLEEKPQEKIRLIYYLKSLFPDNKKEIYIKLYLNTIEKMASISKSRNQLFIVGYIRDDFNFLHNTKWTDDKIISEIRKRDIQVIDLSLRNHPPEKLILSKEDSHPSAYANELRGNLIYDYIKNKYIFNSINPAGK